MNLGKLGSVDQSKISKADELKSHGLDEVKVIFTFPDGKTHEQSVSASPALRWRQSLSLPLQFRSDLTIGYLKIAVEKKCKIPYASQVQRWFASLQSSQSLLVQTQEFFLGDRQMLDPFSLSDYPIDSPPVKITVKQAAEESVRLSLKLSSQSLLSSSSLPRNRCSAGIAGNRD